MKSGKTLIELATEIESQKARKVDFTATTPDIRVTVNTDEETKKNLPVVFNVENVGAFPVKDLPLTQVAEHTKIPVVYARKMAQEAPELLATNINTWFQQNKTQRRLVRVLDGNARAFLSDKYQRIDNFEVANSALEALTQYKGLQIRSTEVTEHRLYIKATFPGLQREITSRRGQESVNGAKVGDIVEAGVLISNSEVGLGSVSVSDYSLYLWCLNGAVTEKSKRWTHVGSKIEGEEIGYLSDDTLKAGDKFDLLRIRDAIGHAFDERKFEKYIAKVQGATADQIAAASVTKGVEVLSSKLLLTKEEGNSVLAHLIQGGDLSRYGLFNAVTRTAEDSPSYDRATELEALGQKVIDLTANDWQEVAQAA